MTTMQMTTWGAEIPLDVTAKPSWLGDFDMILRIPRNATVPSQAYYPQGLSRGEWAATKAIKLSRTSPHYQLAEVKALIAGEAPAGGSVVDGQGPSAADAIAALKALKQRTVAEIDAIIAALR